MSTYTSEPGTRLAGRYRLVDRVGAGSGWTLWKAMDETLARHVTVLTFAPGFPRIPEVVTAARAASRMADSRLAQVFDVEDVGEQAYIVMEWVTGQSVIDMLAEGPLEPGRAVALVAEAARALAVAHASGLAHLRLTPQSLRWTKSGGVKITGLGIDAALAGEGLTAMGAGDPALTDTRDLARLLYASLTGYWPGDEPGPLPPAPLADGLPCTPRQVTAAVPPAVDEVVCRALLQRQMRHGGAITSPATFADELSSVAPPMPLPEPAPAPARPPTRPPGPPVDQMAMAGQPDGYSGFAPAGSGGYRRRYPANERSVATRAIISAVIVLVLVAVGLTAWMVSNGTHSGGQPTAGRSNSSTGPAVQASSLLIPLSAHSFDPFGHPTKTEDEQDAHFVIAKNPTGFWSSSYYFNHPNFGNLKPGTGLILDMGKQVRLSQVAVTLGTKCCAHLEIRIGNDNTSLDALTTVASSDHATGTVTLPVGSTTTGRYVLVWFTSLPPRPSNSSQFQVFVHNITVRGAPAAGAG